MVTESCQTGLVLCATPTHPHSYKHLHILCLQTLVKGSLFIACIDHSVLVKGLLCIASDRRLPAEVIKSTRVGRRDRRRGEALTIQTEGLKEHIKFLLSETRGCSLTRLTATRRRFPTQCPINSLPSSPCLLPPPPPLGWRMSRAGLRSSTR